MATDFLSDGAIRSVLAKLEIERQKIAKTQTKGYVLLFAGLIIGLAGGFLDFPIPGIIIGIIAAIFGGVFLYRISDELKQYKHSFKLDIIGQALKGVDQSLNIDPSLGVLESEFVNTQLFTNTPDRYNTEDFVNGKADKTSFYFSEVHAEYKTETPTKNGTRTDWHEIFKGIIFCADFNKNFKGATIVRPKYFGNSLGAWFSKNIFSIGNQNVIQLENAYFDETFITYGMDQVEARYILTPAMMERILTLNTQSKSTISLSFINTRLYIAFPLSRNCFEAPVFKSLLDPNLLNEDIAIIKFMYAIVNELDLNTRIWGKN